MSWLDWAVDDPAPGNCGYSTLNVPCELADPSLRRGNTVHIVEGWFTYVNPSAVMDDRGNSWPVTIMRSGQVWRHRPRPTFVNWHAGGPAQNIGTDGIEMEGKDQPWTDEQKASLLRVLKETWEWFGWTDVVLGRPTDRTQEGIRQALLVRGYGSLWEHRWFDYTSCPSGRNEWDWLVPELTMAVSERGTTMWRNWESMGGAAIGGPAVASWAEGRLDVFVVGTDGALYHKWYVSGQGWKPNGLKGPWERLGAPAGVKLVGTPATVSWAEGRIDVFAVDDKGKPHHLGFER